MQTLGKIYSDKKHFLPVSIALIFATLLSQSVQAQTIPPRGPVPFHVYDTDRNGCISAEEFNKVQQLRMQSRQSQGQGTGMGQGRQQNRPDFDDFDKNADGFISEQELIEARSMRISERIQQGYQMKNTAKAPSFKAIDTNSDGKISREEFSQHQVEHQQQRQRNY